MNAQTENRPEPIITLSPRAHIFVKIKEANHIEAGRIQVFGGEQMLWMSHILTRREEPYRVNIKLNHLHNLPPYDLRYIAPLGNLPNIPFDRTQSSTCFVIDGEDVWHADITPGDPILVGFSSAVIHIFARNPLQNNRPEIWGGLLVPWEQRTPPPVWVRRCIAAMP